MKRIIGITFAILICLALAALGIIFNPPAFTELQKDTMIILAIACGVSILYCFVVGEISRNNSQMDKLWSITPIIYSLIIVIKGWGNYRLLIMAAVIAFWGVRLTYNFAKKGAYSIKFWSGEEDYRWALLRKNKILGNKFVWCLFDLFFISIYQNVLVLAITFPMVAIMESTVAINYLDIIFGLLAFGFVALELIADHQQRNFYNKRKELMKDGTPLKDIEPPYNKGFNTMGIWKYSRHPNYLSEQMIWVSLYLFTISAGVCNYGVFNWSIVGCMFLVMLFQGSATLGEKISSSKYPEYKNYIKTTSQFIPWFNRKIK